MEKDYEIIKDGPVLTVVLGEELSVLNSPALNDDLIPYKGQGVKTLVFDATRLTHLSSSGVRVILYCKKYLSHNLEIVFVNCNDDVFNVLDLVGLCPYITFVQR
jgi:anti-anti-sigma factor